MKLATLQDLFVHELQDIYSAEMQLTKALPKMAKAATAPELRAAFEKHLAETETQAQRLEQIFSQLGVRAGGVNCKAMQGLIAEGEEMINTRADDSVRDAGLISAAQRVEHYEIAAYGSARTYAQILGHSDVQRILQQSLDEEGQTDKNLTALAERVINVEAARGA